MRLSVADVLRELSAAGLAGDDALPLAREALRPEIDEHLPWYLSAAIALGAWSATAFLLGFVLALFGADSAALNLTIGIALVALSVWARRQGTSEFFRHATVAACLAGQGLVMAGIYEATDSERLTAAVVAIVALVLIWIMPDPMHRFFSTLAFVLAKYVGVVTSRIPHGYEITTIALVVFAALAWRYRVAGRSKQVDDVLGPVGYALVIAIVGALVVATATHFGSASLDPGDDIRLTGATTMAITFALAALAWTVMDERGIPHASGVAFATLAGVVILGLATLSTPGIVAGAAVLALAFDRRQKVLAGIGILFLIVFSAVYYYSLHITLLEKAGVLAGSGVLLLAVRHRIARA